MFSLRSFIKNGFLRAVGSMEDYKIILNAASWNEKGVLELSDLEEIQKAIDDFNASKDDKANAPQSNPQENESEAG